MRVYTGFTAQGFPRFALHPFSDEETSPLVRIVLQYTDGHFENSLIGDICVPLLDTENFSIALQWLLDGEKP